MKTRVTLADVARVAGVSTQTVSRAINNRGEISETTRQHILQISANLGFRPNRIARSLVTNRTMIIGLIIPDVTNPFFSEVALGAVEEAFSRGYNSILLNSRENPDREKILLGVLEETQADGVMVCSSRLPDAELAEYLARHKAAVLMNRSLPGSNVSSICNDDFDGARQALLHLLAMGRRKIGIIYGPKQSIAGQNRMRAYENILPEAGIRLDPTMKMPCGPNLEDGKEAVLELLLQHPEIDGLLCYNDLIAVGAIQGCHEIKRRIPEDIAIIGFDDILLGRLITPSLTTLSVAQKDLGARAMQMLIKRIEGDNQVENHLMKEKLIIRQSAPI